MVARLFAFLASMALVLSLGMTATAHAMERPDVTAASHASAGEVAAEGHAPGDADQVPADGDKGYPHHHGGCHGDHVAAPVKVAATTGHVVSRATFAPADRPVRPLATADPALRPPQA